MILSFFLSDQFEKQTGQGNISCSKCVNHAWCAGNWNCAMSPFHVLNCLKTARYYNLSQLHPCLDHLVESNNNLCCTKGGAVLRGIPFNFLAEALASLYQKTPHPLTDSL